ncbi:atrial natriuretic peptide receptor 1-like isoform X2 [Paramacrobiotus metropolitanus]|uniref:atrial natriuretic peptide receptor 1-like isoform X2 n=1 Tax=Paramacrobiotus metropolitanus TaxID=2943436 RepID=UPI00244575D1|nr:atrial natriuretic peptide receptor 1-like isoform X2 [Paramacrobiotus metropolitanus]XP_055348284.1 atrial natriuretic peptide receptor 1-like isoform X2 [Paramacrobiotus metropolitanus]
METTYLFPMKFSNQLWRSDPWSGKLAKTTTSGHYVYLHRDPDRDRINSTILDELRERSKKYYGHTYSSNEEILDDEQVTLFTTGYYEAIVTISQILTEKAWYLHAHTLHDKILEKLAWGRMFCSDLGCVKLNNNGDKDNNYSVKSLPEDAEAFQEVYLWDKSDFQLVPFLGRSVYWPGNRSAPANVPLCGFFGEVPQCQQTNILPYAVAAGSLVAIISIAATVAGMRRYQNQARRESAWEISVYEIIFPLRSNSSDILPDIMQHYMEGRAVYKETTVWARRCANVQRGQMRSDWIDLINARLNAKHENIAIFIGCAFTPSCAYVVTEYFAKGSLDELLAHKKKWMDMTLQMSLLFDIAEGLSFIHTTVFKCHGLLKSTNCMVTDRFGIRLTDFGIPFLSAKWMQKTSAGSQRALLQKAADAAREEPSKEADIHRLGLIMLEVSSQTGDVFHGREFINNMSEASAYVNKEIRGHPHTTPRPRSSTCCTMSLAARCCEQDAARRPSITVIRRILEKVSHRSGNKSYFDLLLDNINSYANKLEIRFHEQNGFLVEEMAKSAALLKEIFPPTIAEALRFGKSIPPESFESATVIFTKICDIGFITTEGHPETLFNILNEIYIVMDRILSRFDVYKVETISENYMVVSGVPVRCAGSQHAGQALQFGCAVVQSMSSTLFGGQEIRVCVGIHSGPLVAGIVGIRMQRYCLFGDTVNVTSRLSTTCEGQKVQASPDTKLLVDTLPIFRFQCRGTISLKGRGLMKTYWVFITEPAKLLSASS